MCSTYLPIQVFSILNIFTFPEFNVLWISAFTLSISFLVKLLLTIQLFGLFIPIFILSITRKKILQIDFKPYLIKKYGVLINGFTFYNCMTRSYYFIFFVRRLLFSFIICFPSSLQLVQLSLNLILNILVIQLMFILIELSIFTCLETLLAMHI